MTGRRTGSSVTFVAAGRRGCLFARRRTRVATRAASTTTPGTPRPRSSRRRRCGTASTPRSRTNRLRIHPFHGASDDEGARAARRRRGAARRVLDGATPCVRETWVHTGGRAAGPRHRGLRGVWCGWLQRRGRRHRPHPSARVPRRVSCRLTVSAYSVGHVLNDMCAACWFSYLLLFLQNVVECVPASSSSSPTPVPPPRNSHLLLLLVCVSSFVWSLTRSSLNSSLWPAWGPRWRAW